MFRIPALVIGAAAALLVTTGLTGRQSPTIPRQQSQEPRFRTGVGLVRLSVTARDQSGTIVHDLEPGDFQVVEDGVEQEVEHFGHHESPISVVVLVDKSGSMAGDKLMHAKDAVINFAGALQPQDEVLVIAFSEGVEQLGQFGLDARTIEHEVKGIRIESSTRLYDAVIEGSKAVATPDRKALQRTRGPQSLWTRLGDSHPLDMLKRLTEGTGGWTYPIVAAERCKEVCLRVADELRNQYLLGYYPANKTQDGRWRAITVRTARPGLTLTTRTGYYGPQS